MNDRSKSPGTRRRARWKIALAVFALLAIGVVTPALIPPSGRYDPAPYFEAVKRSAALPLTRGQTPPVADLIIRDARIVDVNGVRGPISIRIAAGRITAIGADVGSGPAELNVGGATVMPGLIDAHAHLSLTPGGLTRGDDATTTRSLRLHHMRAYLACGITTIFDPAVENVVMEDIHRHLQAGHPGPRYFGVGTPLAVPGGYMESLWPPAVHSAQEIGPRLDAIVKAGGVGVKIPFERGYDQPVWPLHTPAVEEGVLREAGKRNLPIYAHAERADMVRRALALHPRAIVHVPFDGTKDLAAELATAKVSVITTLSLFDAPAIVLHREQIETLHLRRFVPAIELETLGDKRQYHDYIFGLLTEVAPWVRGRYRDWLTWFLGTERGLRVPEEKNRELAQSAMQSIRFLRDAGVTLVMGTDSGNWPLFPYYFHGPTSWRELRMLAEAGLSPKEVLAAATVNPARMLGIADRFGTVDVGKDADLVIVRDDPLTDVYRAMLSIAYTVRGGVARTPEAWMSSQ